MSDNLNDFKSQSSDIIEILITKNGLSREEAIKQWFMSKTYQEIQNRRLFYISATRAYYEFCLEKNKSSEWMNNPFDI